MEITLKTKVEILDPVHFKPVAEGEISGISYAIPERHFDVTLSDERILTSVPFSQIREMKNV